MLKISPADQLQLLTNKLSDHIGSGDQAHLTVDFDHAGFMTPDHLMALFHANGREKQLADDKPVDIFSLSAGHFYGTNFLNTPPTNGQGVWVLDISKPAWNGQAYTLRNIANGEIWYQVRHTDKNANVDSRAANGWTKVETAFPLWEGDFSALNATINLADQRAKFRLMRVTVATGNGFNAVETFQNSDEFTLNASQVTSNAYGAFVYQANLRLQGATGHLVVNRSVQLTADGIKPYTDLIHVKKIEGII